MCQLNPTFYRFIRSVIPRFVISSFRIVFIYEFLRSHSKKNKCGLSIDANFKPIPWMPYPIIDFLNTLELTDLRIFEYGVGSSTIWWSNKVQFVAGVEMEKKWCDKIINKHLSNVEIILCEDGGQYPGLIHNFKFNFDIVVIDGAERYKSAQQAIKKLNKNGFIILDNSDWYPNTAAFLFQKGMNQIDFTGFGPINSFPSVASIFFWPECNLFRRRNNKTLSVIGGHKLYPPAFDDCP